MIKIPNAILTFKQVGAVRHYSIYENNNALYFIGWIGIVKNRIIISYSGEKTTKYERLIKSIAQKYNIKNDQKTL